MLPARPGSIIITMLWQPMPAPTSAPSGTLVDELCGQPEQKKGVRETDNGISSRRAGGSGSMRAARRWANRLRSRGAMVSASSVPVIGNRVASLGACFPYTIGASVRP